MTHPTAPWAKHEGLIGRTIMAVGSMTDVEAAEWDVDAIVLELDDGSRWWLSSDSEGNRGGDIHQLKEGYPQSHRGVVFTQEELKEIAESLQSTLDDSVEHIYDGVSKETAIGLYDTDPNVSALVKVDPETAAKIRKFTVNNLEKWFDRG